MIRIVLAGLAVLAAVLALLTGESWLYAAAGGIGGVALGLGVHWWWTTYIAPESHGDRRRARGAYDEFGLSEVRPMAPSEGQKSEKQAARPSPNGADSSTSKKKGAPVAKKSASGKPVPAEGSTAAQETTEDQPGAAEGEQDTRITAFVRALRYTLHANTVALLVQEEMALEYRIAGLDSKNGHVQRTGTFSTSHPLLTAGMSRSKVTVRTLSDNPDLRDALNYYTDAPSADRGIDKVAFAPIQHAQQSATYFLVVDASEDVPLDHHHTQRLIARSAETLGSLLGYDPATLRPSVTAQTSQQSANSAKSQRSASKPPASPAAEKSESAERSSAQSSSDQGDVTADSVDITTPSPKVERQGPRPRLEIIAEEMEVARATDIPLALALVHVNRSEMLAEQGQDTVEQAEALLLDALEEMAAGQRVERFGELTYGIFYQGTIDDVEAWTVHTHQKMQRRSDLLKGGVSIGVTMMGPRHKHAKALRTEAMKALHESYKSGAPALID